MICQIHSLNPQLLHRRIHTKSKQFSLRPNHDSLKPTLFPSSSSYNNQNKQLVSSTATIKENQTPKSDVYNVKFVTLGACKLGISRYPDFQYNAEGGAGSGTASRFPDSDGDDDSDGDFFVDFDVKQLYIPPLSAATTKFLGLPLPPFLKIDIIPEAFQGKINQESCKVDLKFRAKFCFSVGSIYKAAPLLVETVLTSEESKGKMRGGKGQRMDKDGVCRLVGVATVEPINDIFMDTFLSLPTECLAELNAVISFSPST